MTEPQEIQDLHQHQMKEIDKLIMSLKRSYEVSLEEYGSQVRRAKKDVFRNNMRANVDAASMKSKETSGFVKAEPAMRRIQTINEKVEKAQAKAQTQVKDGSEPVLPKVPLGLAKAKSDGL